METALSAWYDATEPVDVSRLQENLLLFTEVSKTSTLGLKRRQKGECKDTNEERYYCRPWDYASFIARVSSFRTIWWFAKPLELSALECACHGWSNSGPDELQCKCCKQFLCFQLDSKLSAEGVLNVARMFAGQLVTGHTELCPWRGNPSPEAFMMLPIATKQQVFESFLERMREETMRMRNDVRLQKRMASVDVASAIMTQISKEMSDDEDAAADLYVSAWASKLLAKMDEQDGVHVDGTALVHAALLIVCGWKYDERDGASTDMLVCNSCGRQWPAPSARVGEEDSGEPPAKRSKTDVDRSVNLLTQHRHFCPWIVERMPAHHNKIDPKLEEFSKLPGWKQYAQALRLLGNSKDNVVRITDSGDVSEKRAIDPVQALATVQALFGV